MSKLLMEFELRNEPGHGGVVLEWGNRVAITGRLLEASRAQAGGCRGR